MITYVWNSTLDGCDYDFGCIYNWSTGYSHIHASHNFHFSPVIGVVHQWPAGWGCDMEVPRNPGEQTRWYMPPHAGIGILSFCQTSKLVRLALAESRLCHTSSLGCGSVWRLQQMWRLRARKWWSVRVRPLSRRLRRCILLWVWWHGGGLGYVKGCWCHWCWWVSF